MKRKIIIDLDGVFIDIHKVIQEHVSSLYPEFNMKNVYTYDFNKSLKTLQNLNTFFEESVIDDILSNNFDTSLKAPRNFILKLLSVEKIFEESKPFDKSMENIRDLMNNKDCHVIFNSSAYSSKIAGVKYKQLLSMYPNEEYTISISIGEKPIYYDNPIVIEDSLEELTKYYRSNVSGTYFLIDKPYNQEIFNPSYSKVLENIKRVKDINEAISMIKDML